MFGIARSCTLVAFLIASPAAAQMVRGTVRVTAAVHFVTLKADVPRNE